MLNADGVGINWKGCNVNTELIKSVKGKKYVRFSDGRPRQNTQSKERKVRTYDTSDLSLIVERTYIQ